MKGELLILFVILLLALILCSILGGTSCTEGFTYGENSTTYTAPNGSTAVVVTNDAGESKAIVSNPDGTIVTYTATSTQQGQYGTVVNYSEPNGGTALLTTANSGITTFSTKNADNSNTVIYTSESSTDSSTSNTSNSTTTDSSYDNYNHYSGTAYPTIFYGPNGGTARVISTANNGTIVTTSSNGTTQIYYINPNVTTDANVKSYYGPNGGSATIVTDSNGKQAVEITMPDGTKVLYYSDNIYVQNSQDDTINQYDSDAVTTGSDYNNAFSATTYYGPNGGQATTVTGPAGNTYATYDSSAYYNSQQSSQGIPKSMIPPGQEDLYILKSQVVPPVCPVCPEPIVQCPENNDVTKCPPCPPCARCPEPSFECAKVPNYKAFNPDTMPVPVLNDFSSFGM
jgi:hypothetical protein